MVKGLPRPDNHGVGLQPISGHRRARTLLALACVAACLGVTPPAHAVAARSPLPSAVTRVAPTSPTKATIKSNTKESRLAAKINQTRTDGHLRPYRVSPSLSAVAERQAHAMATQQRLFHNPSLTTDVRNWRAVGENVAYTSRSVAHAHAMFLASPPHRENVLSSTFTEIGLGVVKDRYGTLWVVEVFRAQA